MNNIIKRTWNQNRMVNIEDLRGMAFQAESGGHTFEISGIDDTGAAVALSGTVSGVFRRPDNADIALTGSASDGVVSVTLSEDCYAVPGRFGLTIFVTSNSQKVAVYACVGAVAVSSTGNVAGDTPASVEDLIDDINAAIADLNTAIGSIPADYSQFMAAIAPAYSSSALYAVGSYAWHDGTLHRCTTPITTAESWTAAHWMAVNLGGDVSNLKSALTDTQSDAKTALSILAQSGFSPNLLNSDTVIADCRVNVNTGALFSGAGYTTTDFIKVIPGKDYSAFYKYNNSIVRLNVSNVVGYNEKQQFAENIGGITSTYKYRTIPSGVYYVRLCFNSSTANVEDIMFVETDADTAPTKFYPFGRYDQKAVAKELYGKKAMFFGDSITADENRYRKWLLENTGMKLTHSFAVSGAKLCNLDDTQMDGNPSYSNNNTVPNQVQQLLNGTYDTPDIVIISAGINDDHTKFTGGLSESEFTDSSHEYIDISNCDLTTPSGAMRWMYEKIMTVYPSAQVFYATPIQCGVGLQYYAVVQKKRNTIVEIANRMSLCVIDAFYKSGIYGRYEKKNVQGKYLADGLHPNVAGGKLLAKCYEDEIRSNLHYVETNN